MGVKAEALVRVAVARRAATVGCQRRRMVEAVRRTMCGNEFNVNLEVVGVVSFE